MIIVKNNHQDIIETNFWESDFARKGYYYVTSNAGAVRLLIPKDMGSHIREMKTCCEVVVTFGFHSEYGRRMAEFMFEDRTENPFVLFVSDEQWQHLPTEKDYGRKLVFTAWEHRRCQPHKIMERELFLREAPDIPFLKHWIRR